MSKLLVSNVAHVTPYVKCINSEFNKNERLLAIVEKKALFISVQYVAVRVQNVSFCLESTHTDDELITFIWRLTF